MAIGIEEILLGMLGLLALGVMILMWFVFSVLNSFRRLARAHEVLAGVSSSTHTGKRLTPEEESLQSTRVVVVILGVAIAIGAALFLLDLIMRT